jgi:predicted secreted protein
MTSLFVIPLTVSSSCAQPTGKNQIEVFWKVVDENPGPLFAGVIFFGLVECE